MPLIKCPDCGQELSPAAPACPKCARPMLPPVAAQPMRTQPAIVVQTQSKATRFVFWCFAAVIIFVIAAVCIPIAIRTSLPSHFKSKESAEQFGCVLNLRNIEGAKAIWNLEKGQLTNQIPTDDDLFGPNLAIRTKPSCPSGGTYSLNSVSNAPTCSVAGHTI